MVNNEMDSAVTVLRTLLTSSRSKGGILIDQLLSDYRALNEGALPLKKFGFETFEDFLNATNEFKVTRGHDGVRVTARHIADSARIKGAIDDGKTVRKTKTTAGLQPRRPVRQSVHDVGQPRKSSAFSDIYSTLPSRSIKKAAAATLAHIVHETKHGVPGTNGSTSRNGNVPTKIIRHVVIQTSDGDRPQPRALYQPPHVSRAFTQNTAVVDGGAAASTIPKRSLNSRLAKVMANSDAAPSIATNNTDGLNKRLTRLQRNEETVDFVRSADTSNGRQQSEVTFFFY